MGIVWPLTYLATKELVKFGPEPAFLHPYHLFGRETAHIQPPTLTLDPKPIHFYAEVLHLCIETFGGPQMCNSGKGHQVPLFGWGLAGLTASKKMASERPLCPKHLPFPPPACSPYMLTPHNTQCLPERLWSWVGSASARGMGPAVACMETQSRTQYLIPGW